VPLPFAVLVAAAALATIVVLALALHKARAATAAAAARTRALEEDLRRAQETTANLERDMKERTAALEQQKHELGEALEKLRRAQGDVVRNEKLASMGRLVAGVAHEVNNPMNAVINTLGPLEETLTAANATEALAMLRVIKNGAQRTKAIVQALHNYSRGDTETLTNVNLLASLDDTVDLLRHRLKKIEVVKDIDPGARIVGFAGQIDQVLMNLLTNAVQAIGDRPGVIRIGLHRRGNEVVLSVADDGKGIAPELLPRIFDPFFTTKDVGEGAGLGLSIVHGIVERHGGRVGVESAPGAGSTFRVVLPVHAGLVAAVRQV
jgi:signal transduction histidine kinase